MRAPPPGFEPFDVAAPDGDIEAAIDACPPHAHVKGMFNIDLQKHLTSAEPDHSVRTERFSAFLDYSARDYLELIVETARVCHPDVPRPEAIRRTGLNAFTEFASSSIGRVLFSLLNNNPARIAATAPKAYKFSVKPFKMKIVKLDDDSMHCTMELTTFMYTNNVGVWAGAFAAIDVNGHVFVKRADLFCAEFFITW